MLIKTVMGVDQSLTCTGVVILDKHYALPEGRQLEDIEFSGSIKTVKMLTDDFVLDTYYRANQIADELIRLIVVHQVDILCFETPSLASKGNATRTLPMLLGCLLGRLTKIVKEHGIALYFVPPSSLKKFATGKGNAKKEDMFDSLLDSCPELHNDLINKPKNVGRYDITDAYYLAQWASSQSTK